MFKDRAIKNQIQLMMDAVNIQGKSISRVCLFCCEYIHQVAYQKEVKIDNGIYVLQTHEWKRAIIETTHTHKSWTDIQPGLHARCSKHVHATM